MKNNNQTIEAMLVKFMPFAQERMGFESAPEIRLESDEVNAQQPLGKTAYYDPSNSTVTVFVDGRHPKDIMRSISHELVHHTQNGRGEFEKTTTVGEGYAQNDDHLREMEREAYEQGNLCFRDWEDSIKTQNEELDMFQKRNKKLNEGIMKKFGYKAEPLTEEVKGLGLDDNWRQLSSDEYAATEQKVDAAIGKILGEERWDSIRDQVDERYGETLWDMLKEIVMIGETHFFGKDLKGENSFFAKVKKMFDYPSDAGQYPSGFQEWLINQVKTEINNSMTGREYIHSLTPEMPEDPSEADPGPVYKETVKKVTGDDLEKGDQVDDPDGDGTGTVEEPTLVRGKPGATADFSDKTEEPEEEDDEMKESLSDFDKEFGEEFGHLFAEDKSEDDDDDARDDDADGDPVPYLEEEAITESNGVLDLKVMGSGGYDIEINGEDLGPGGVVKALIAKNVFSQEVVNALLAGEKSSGQDMERWDTDVLQDHYDIDVLEAVKKFAEINGLKIVDHDGAFEPQEEESDDLYYERNKRLHERLIKWSSK